MLRSILVVAAGFALIAILSIATGMGIHAGWPAAFDAAGRTDSVPILILMLVYVGVYAVGGCYLTARFAPNRPMMHALVLGAVGLVFNVVGAAMAWNMAPAWYNILGLLLVMPYAWLGGRMRVRQLERRPVPVAA